MLICGAVVHAAEPPGNMLDQIISNQSGALKSLIKSGKVNQDLRQVDLGLQMLFWEINLH